MSLFRLIFALSCFFPFILQANSSIPYTGKLSIGGENFNQPANFSFTISDANGSIHWSTDSPLELNVRNGRYFALLGGQSTPPLPPRLFLDHSSLILKVSVDLKDGEGMRPLLPDQPITATPLALAAEYARIAESVAPGSITRDMLSADVLADLNRTQTVPSSEPSTSSFEVTPGSITHELLSPAVLAALNSSISQITREMLPPSVLADLNKSINRSDLPSSVLADLNRTITRDMLPASVLADLNKSITRNDLPSSVLADLNRTITKNNLGSDVLSDLNSSISLNRLSPEVLAALQVTPSISTQPFARYDWRTNSATIEARGRGHNLSYQWLKNGQVIAGAKTPVLELSNPVLDDNATYSVQLTNSVGQTTSHNITLQQAIGAPGLPLAEANATEVPRNGLILWMDANDLDADGKADHLPDDQFVDYWKSKIGDVNATQSDSAQKANIKKLPHNNLTCLSFDGNDFMLDNNVSLPTRCVFLVFETRGNTKYNSILGNISIGYDWSHNFYGGDFVEGSEGSFRGNGKNGEIGSYNKLGIVFLTRGNDAPNQGLYTSLKLNLNGWEGDFAEILFYNRALSNNERNSVERYLADKWGIQLYADKIAAEQALYNAAKPEAEPENGLLAYYKFEPVYIEPEKLWDYSGNNHHGILKNFNDGNPWVDGIDGKSIQFDGINDFVDLPSISGSHKSFTFWMRADFPINKTASVVKVWSPRTDGPHYFSVNGGQHFKINNNHSSSSSLPNASFGTITGWTHIAMIYEEAYEFYLNGQKIDKTGNCPLFSGEAPHLGDYSYQGRLDEFRFYNRTLTPLEIQLLYAETNSEPILRTDIEHNASVGTAYSLTLSADNSPTTYFAEGLPPGLVLNLTTGEISGTPQSAGVYPVTIRTSNEHGTSEDIIQLSVYPPSYEPPLGFSSIGEDDVPTNKLALWLDANDVDADGQKDDPSSWQTFYGRLPKWSDKSTNQFDALQDAQTGAYYRENVLNGKSTFRFGSNQPGMLLGANYIFSFGAGEENGLTIIAVANSNDPVSNSTPRILVDFGKGTGKGWGITYRKNGGSFYTSTDHNGTSIDYSINKAPGDFSIASYRVTFGQIQEVFVDGELLASKPVNLLRLTNTEVSANNAGTSDSGPFTIGGSSAENNGSPLHGDIAELMIWKRALTDSERVVVEQYLAQKWGLQHQTYLPPLEQPETGLLGRWTFDEGEGDLVHDVSGNRKHGTMTNMHSSNSWVDGAYGKALEFDGVEDNFTIPNLGDEYRTITFWLKTGQLSAESMIAEFGAQSIKLNVNSRPLNLFQPSIKGTNTPTSLVLTNTGWGHIAYRWSLASNRYDVFFNGQAVTVGDMWGSHATMIIDQSIVFPSSPTIKIDDLRVYSRSLSDAEIRDLCGDNDSDGLTDVREAELGTNPNLADTDGDGDSDGSELTAGTSPTDPNKTIMSKALTNGLQVHLKFDETNGTTAFDSSGNNKHATLYGFESNQTAFVQGRVANAIELDGVNDYVMLPNALGINFTFSFWIKTLSNLGDSNSSNWDGQIGLITSGSNKHAMMLSQGKFKIWSGTSTACRMTSQILVNNDSWIHLAGSRTQTFSGGNTRGNFKLYLNGSLDSSISSIENTRFTDGAILHIGKTQDGIIYYDGLIDNIHIYDRMLPDDEVQALYNLGQ